MSGSFDSFHLLGRTGTARDMAHTITFQLSLATSWVTGAIWHVDGGVMAGCNSQTISSASCQRKVMNRTSKLAEVTAAGMAAAVLSAVSALPACATTADVSRGQAPAINLLLPAVPAVTTR